LNADAVTLRTAPDHGVEPVPPVFVVPEVDPLAVAPLAAPESSDVAPLVAESAVGGVLGCADGDAVAAGVLAAVEEALGATELVEAVGPLVDVACGAVLLGGGAEVTGVGNAGLVATTVDTVVVGVVEVGVGNVPG